MSFSGTPLGQGRRLDHYTFLNKPNPNAHQRPPASPPKSNHIPTSYAYGAPVPGSRSPPKVTSATSRGSHSRGFEEEDDPKEPALVRFARLKQRTSDPRRSGSNGTANPLDPEKWSVKDTSVNIAAAFHQAATTVYDEMPPADPNASWASGHTKSALPRSTSVEYEKETQSTTTRRLAPPPNRLAPPRSNQPVRRPLAKTQSVRHVSDSEGEEEVNGNGRGKSPFEQAVDFTKRALAPATFYLKQRSQEPQAGQAPSRTNGDNSHSYDYSAEEREFQATQNNGTNGQKPPSPAARRANANHRRNRMSVDNKAYRPTTSDVEVSDEDVSDDGKKGRRRKKKKKEPIGGPLTTLPVAKYDKRRKKRATKGGAAGEEEEDDYEEGEQSSSEDHVSVQRGGTTPSLRPPLSRGSAAPSRASVPRNSAPAQQLDLHDSGFADTSLDIEQGLDSIPEHEEPPPKLDKRHHSHPPTPSSFSVGALLGKIVYIFGRSVKGIVQFFFWLLSGGVLVIGKVFGTVFDVMFYRPAHWLRNANPATLMKLAAFFLLASFVYAGLYQLKDPSLNWLPSRHRPTFHAPGVPAADIAELASRLQNLENVLSGLSLDHEITRSKQDSESRAQAELLGRLGTLESRVQKESSRILEAETEFRTSASRGLQAVRDDIEALQAQVKESGDAAGDGRAGNDEEARVKLKALEERLGSVEGGVKEALESSKSSVKVGGPSGAAPSGAAAWWNKLASGTGAGSTLTIKSTDGQDVTSLIGNLVDSAVSRYSKDVVARPDFALHSAGGRIVPSLTSDTLEVKPANLRSYIVSRVFGPTGHGIGLPPVTALHHELHSGHCWPFAGSVGQLGVMLAQPTYITEVTIDHLAKEVAFDMRSAPRDMELWGLVEGKDNVDRVREWREEKLRRREAARLDAEDEGVPLELEEDEEEYPKTLPPNYIPVAKFTYDIHSPHNIQTFPVSQHIRDLSLDFGMVALIIRSNWGMEEFTCLYRVRVHGERVGETPLPYPEDSV